MGGGAKLPHGNDGGGDGEGRADAWRHVLKLFQTVRPPRAPSLSSRAAAAPATTDAAADQSKGAVTEAAEDDMCCSICLEGLGLGPAQEPATRRVAVPVVALPCSHRFHRKCITECVKHAPRRVNQRNPHMNSKILRNVHVVVSEPAANPVGYLHNPQGFSGIAAANRD